MGSIARDAQLPLAAWQIGVAWFATPQAATHSKHRAVL
jgi:hypothetical protein